MIKSAVTISLVPEARGGPFIFWDDLREGCRKAAELGFDGVEVFAPDAEAFRRHGLRDLLRDHGLRLAAAGTGAGWVKHKLTLTSPDPQVRHAAKEFIRSIVDAAGEFGAPTIIGSMQGRSGPDVDKSTAVGFLVETLGELARRSQQHGTVLLFEPLNHGETNLVRTLNAGSDLLSAVSSTEVRLLADFYHMAVERMAIPATIRNHEGWIGHVHFADSNRRPVGYGETDFSGVALALQDIRYDGYVSAEALPYPNSDMAAKATIEAFRYLFRK